MVGLFSTRAGEPSPGRINAAMLVLVAIWGLNFPVVKGAFADLPPFAFNGLRFSVAALLLLIVLRRLEAPKRIPGADIPRLLLLGLLGHAGYQTLFMAGLARTTAGHSSLILALVPLFVGALCVLLGLERPSPRIWAGLVIAFAGVFVLIAGGGGLASGGGSAVGDLLTLLASLCWAAYTVLSRPLLRRMSALRLTTVTLFFGLPVILASAIPGLLRVDWPAVSLGSWAALAFSSIFAVVISYVIWYTSVQAFGSARTALFSYLIPVVALASAWVLLGEPTSGLQILGGSVALFGVWLARREAVADGNE